ncbi:hypothetical protein Dimus_003552 [Dionaea muscipula]
MHESAWQNVFRYPLRSWQTGMLTELFLRLQHGTTTALHDWDDRVLWAAESDGMFSVSAVVGFGRGSSLFGGWFTSLVGVWFAIPSVVMWSIWKVRNKLRFEGLQPNWDKILEDILFTLACGFRSTPVGKGYSLSSFVRQIKEIRDS